MLTSINLGSPWKLFSKSLRILIIIVLIIGVFFRFFNLDRKFYWGDEAYTSLSLSGYTPQEAIEQVYTGQPISVEEVQKYQSIHSDKGLLSTINAVLKGEGNAVPIYFVTLRLWANFFGSSITAIRSFSAFLSLLTLRCLYWLCLELFDSPITAWMAVIIVAVSPFHVLYAQEARMYSLWTLQTVLSSAAFLRAIRLNTKLSWGIYSATILLGFYSYLLSIFVALGQGIYLFILNKYKVNKQLFYYLLSCLSAAFIFLPWLLIILNNKFQEKGNWLQSQDLDLIGLFNIFLNNIHNSLMDFWFIYSFFPEINIPNFHFGKFIKPILTILIGYSVYYLCRKTPIRIWLFVLTLIFISPLFLILIKPAILTQSRYVIPSYLGIQISIAYLFAAKISDFSISSREQKMWRLAAILLITGGIISCLISSQAETWSNKFGSNQRPVANIINQSPHPLVISDTGLYGILPLSHYLDKKVEIDLVESPSLSTIPEEFSDIFLFNSSQKLRQVIKENKKYKITPIQGAKGLWKIDMK